MDELFIILLVLLVVILLVAVPLTALILAIVALARGRRHRDLLRRVEQLESQIGSLRQERPEPVAAESVEELEEPAAEGTIEQPALPSASRVPAARRGSGIQWELLVGQKALGWVAIVVLLFAVAFFLRYAYENNWIGPLGRVAIGAAAGIALLIWGGRCQRRGAHVIAQIVTSGGVVVSYLATYSAFGYYHLMPQQIAGVLLSVIVALSMVLAIRYRAFSIALTAVLGGLFVPVLMVSEHDQYVALFTYLAVLNLGVVALTWWRTWPGVASIALVGTHLLFWMWHADNYHPEKLPWALGFQAALYGMYVFQSFVLARLADGWAGREQLARRVVNAALFFLAAYVLLSEDYSDWLGAAALGMAAIYTLHARFTLRRTLLAGQTLTSLAIAVGFIAIALPLQANAAWIAVGWAAEAAALWCFGLRIRSGFLRLLALPLAIWSAGRLMLVDLPQYTPDPWLPVLNEFGLPALATVGFLLAAVIATRWLAPDLRRAERVLVNIAGLAVVLLLWLVLSADFYGYFRSLADQFPDQAARWRWIAQMSLSILWAVFASALLWLGFRCRLARLRWLAIALFGVTVAKVFLVDTSELHTLYRIVAFLVLAAFLGLGALAYQRIRIDTETPDGAGGDSDDSDGE